MWMNIRINDDNDDMVKIQPIMTEKFGAEIDVQYGKLGQKRD